MKRGFAWAVAAASAAVALTLSACGTAANQGDIDPAAGATVTVTSTVTETVPASGQGEAPQTVTVTATPAAPADGDPCTIADLSVALGDPEGAAGSSYFPLTFTNTSFRSCTLEGFPTVAYVAGADHDQVGAAAADNGDAGETVTLQPGEVASSTVQQVTVENFPADVCEPTEVAGLRVSLPGGADNADDADGEATGSAFISEDSQTGCAADELPGGQFQMSVSAIVAGLGDN